jgi:hypothetical protein
MVSSPSSGEIVETGVVEKGAIALDHPLPMRDGVKVKVAVQEIAQPAGVLTPLTDAAFLSLPFHGDWADRTDLPASEDYVREERAKWRQRLFREG